MKKYAVIIKERYDIRGKVLKEYIGESRAIEEAHKVYKERTLNKVIVVNVDLKVVFTIERRCKCINIQEVFKADMSGWTQVCMNCGLHIDYNGYREEAQK